MEKRINLKQGDIFLVPFETQEYGIGRIIRTYKKVALVELYIVNPLSSIEEAKAIIEKELPVLKTKWFYYQPIRNGQWPIIGYREVDATYPLPYLWSQDSLTRECYIRQTADEYYGKGKCIAISTEERAQYEMLGLDFGVNIEIYYYEDLIAYKSGDTSVVKKHCPD